MSTEFLASRIIAWLNGPGYGKTRTDLARDAEISVRSLWSILNHKTEPQAATVAAICRVIGIDPATGESVTK